MSNHIVVDATEARLVRKLVESGGYTPDDALAAVRNGAQSTQAPRRAPEGAQAEELPTPDDTGAQRANKTLRVRLPWTPPTTLGANSRKHWRGKHPDEQAAKEVAHRATRRVIGRKGWTCPDMPVLVSVIHWENKSRRKDFDNAQGCLKHAVDGMCDALGIDDKRFLTGMVFQRIDPKKKGFVEFIIRPATAAERKLAS